MVIVQLLYGNLIEIFFCAHLEIRGLNHSKIHSVFTNMVSPASESTPLLANKSSINGFKLFVHGALFFSMIIIISLIARKFIMHQQSVSNLSKPEVSNIFTIKINADLSQFQPSIMTPSTALFGYDMIKQNQFNYTNPTDYIQNTEIFNDYASFKIYGDSLKTVDINNRGIHNQIESILQWILSLTNRSINAFEARWQSVICTQLEHDVAIILESEATFYEKDFMKYLSFLLDNDICIELNNPGLLSIVDTFGNDAFHDIDINAIKNEGVESFGGGIGFGLQIYCDKQLIFDGGAGGGGGYNIEDYPSVFEYGGGGGIQINNVSVGGGTGFETDEYVLDCNADCTLFYGKETKYFKNLLDETECNEMVVSSGGGSGSGFSTKQNVTDLLAWSYYFVNITLVK